MVKTIKSVGYSKGGSRIEMDMLVISRGQAVIPQAVIERYALDPLTMRLAGVDVVAVDLTTYKGVESIMVTYV